MMYVLRATFWTAAIHRALSSNRCFPGTPILCIRGAGRARVIEQCHIIEGLLYAQWQGHIDRSGVAVAMTCQVSRLRFLMPPQ